MFAAAIGAGGGDLHVANSVISLIGEALRMELAAAGDNMKKLREIARVHIARCEAGDMLAIKELANRLDGRPAQIVEDSGPDSGPITKIVREIVHVPRRPKR
jgi:hypothetical protein